MCFAHCQNAESTIFFYNYQGTCSQWYYGPDCDKIAICNRSNTMSFDGNGTCNCAAGWYGEQCDCSQSENDACVGEGEVCRRGRCHCKNGYTRIGNNCTGISRISRNGLGVQIIQCLY